MDIHIGSRHVVCLLSDSPTHSTYFNLVRLHCLIFVLTIALAARRGTSIFSGSGIIDLQEFLQGVRGVLSTAAGFRGQFLINKEALQDRGGREGEDREEHTCQQVGYEHYDDDWEDRGVDLVLEWLGIHNYQITDPTTQNHDHTFANEHQHGTDGGNHGETGSISHDEPESHPGRRTKALTCQSNLDVCILCDILNARVKAPDAASEAAYQALHDQIISYQLLVLLPDVLKS